MVSLIHSPNPALNPVRFALWTLRDEAAQRRLALRYVSIQARINAAASPAPRTSSNALVRLAFPPIRATAGSRSYSCGFASFQPSRSESRRPSRKSAPLGSRRRCLKVLAFLTLSPHNPLVKTDGGHAPCLMFGAATRRLLPLRWASQTL